MSQSTANKDDSTFLHLPGQYTHRPNQGEMSECVVGFGKKVNFMKSHRLSVTVNHKDNIYDPYRSNYYCYPATVTITVAQQE